ncbi:MAG TPA: hypothetical protein VGS41_16230, partial [Chthonomonadales bacterium]|nr:hypothetical protein [Chthonomonadales bacterium]
ADSPAQSEIDHGLAVNDQSTEAAAYILQVGQYVLWTGDGKFLQFCLPALARAAHLVAGTPATSGGPNHSSAIYTDALRVCGKLAADAKDGPLQQQCDRALAANSGRPSVARSALGPSNAWPVTDWLAAELTNAASVALESPAALVRRLEQPGGNPTAEGSEPSAWNALFLLEGFRADLLQGELTLVPNMPGAWSRIDSPIFAPTFRGTVVYRPMAHGGVLTLQIDRLIAVSQPKSAGGGRIPPTVILSRLRLPGFPGPRRSDRAPEVHASRVLEPVGQKFRFTKTGDLEITFLASMSLAAGDRLEVDLHD